LDESFAWEEAGNYLEEANMTFVLSGGEPGNVPDSTVVKRIRAWTP